MQATMQRTQVTAFKAGAAARPAISRGALRVEANKRVQKKQKVILLTDIDKLGSQGELMTVPIGFWRNYLQPQNKAKIASQDILERLRKQKEDAIRAKLQEKAQAQGFANALSTIGKFVLKKKAGDKDQLYSTVTKAEIVDAIYQQTGRNLAEMEMEMPEIKTLGTFECSVKLHPEVTGVFNIVVQKEKQSGASGKKK